MHKGASQMMHWNVQAQKWRHHRVGDQREPGGPR
jgi:hypothetical protein